ncbi:MAG: hypothetical protein M3024_09500 [Candidatus Dormibacteraeota bacterium]|nr:hypothetical protein [Candidatus Dormibacteraeota bacterium]
MTLSLRRHRLLTVAALALTAALLALAFSAARGVNAHAAARDVAHFNLVANPKFAACLARNPGDPSQAPKAEVTVTRGELNDQLTLRIHNVKPHLAFDLFTVQNSSLLASGKADPAFKNFGLAWYQSDVQADADGNGTVHVRTILLNQIFGFDPNVSLDPTNTFHLGFWFNNPNDAAACGFDPSHPTPFNGEHKAGPLAMISVPDATTTLGPLCINPDTSVSPVRCNP